MRNIKFTEIHTYMVGLGVSILCFEFQVWRHTCLALDRDTGKFMLVEDGQLRFSQLQDLERLEIMNSIGDRVNTFTLGCKYWNRRNKYMSMLGSVTDGQVFARFLTEDEMIGFTSCAKPVSS